MSCCCNLCGSRLQDLFEAALRRQHWKGPGNRRGVARDPDEGLVVVVFLETAGREITRIDYQATTCATLLAYCESLVSLAAGKSFEEARALTDSDLVERVRGVPAQRQGRAALPIAALHAALDSPQSGSLSHPNSV